MKKTTALVVTTLAAAIASQAAASETLVYKKADYSGQIETEILFFDALEDGAYTNVNGKIDLEDDDNNSLDHLTLTMKYRYLTAVVKSQLKDGGDLTLEDLEYNDDKLSFGMIDGIAENAAIDDAVKGAQGNDFGITLKPVDGLSVQVASKGESYTETDMDGGADDSDKYDIDGGYNTKQAAVNAAYETAVAGLNVKVSGQVAWSQDKTWDGVANEVKDREMSTYVVASTETTVAGATVKAAGAFTDEAKYFVSAEYPVSAINGKVTAGSKTGETYFASAEAKVAMVEVKGGTWKPEGADAGLWAEVNASQDVSSLNVYGGFKFEKHAGNESGTNADSKVAGETLDFAWAGVKTTLGTVTVGAEVYDLLRVSNEGNVAETDDSITNAKVWAETTVNDATVKAEAYGLLDGMAIKAVASYSF